MNHRQIRKQDSMAMAAGKRAAGITGQEDRVLRREWMTRLAEIPADTRDLTGRTFGDPLPGRSALAQRGQ